MIHRIIAFVAPFAVAFLVWEMATGQASFITYVGVYCWTVAFFSALYNMHNS